VAATIQELIIKGFQIYTGNPSSGLKEKIEMIASHHGTISSFLRGRKTDFDKLVFKVDNPKFKLTEKNYSKIEAFQNSGLLIAELSIQENFIRILTNHFISKQLLMIENLGLETLNINPILSGALNLNNETDLIRYYTYQAISRSIVTSVGFLVQNLLLYSSDCVFEGKNDDLGDETKWDLVVKKLDQVKAYLEIKSGTNDVDKAQIHHYIREIEFIEEQGYKAYIGETYGKRENQTVTHSLYESYLPDWGNRTLIGKELWEFVSGQPDYHIRLMDNLFETSSAFMANDSLIKKIEEKISPLVDDFRRKYETYDNFMKSLW